MSVFFIEAGKPHLEGNIMANDVNSAEVITPSGVVEAVAPTEDVSPVVQDTGVQQTETVSPDVTAAPAGQTEEQAVPFDRFKEVNDAKNALQLQVDQLQGHLRLVGTQPATQPVQPQAQQEGLTLQVMRQMGLDPESYVSPTEQAQVSDAVMKMTVNQITQQIQEQNFVAAHADFAKVVGSKDPLTGQFVTAPPLARILNQNPQLMSALQGPSAYALAYQLAVNDPTHQAELAQQAKLPPQVAGEAAEQAIKAAEGLTSVSAAGTGATIDKSAQIAAMSDEEFNKHKNAVISQGGIAM